MMTGSDEGPLFDEDGWTAAREAVTRSMMAHLALHRAPVFEDHGDHGAGWGSGSFLRLGNRVFILTNEHVATVRASGRILASQLRDLRTSGGLPAIMPNMPHRSTLRRCRCRTQSGRHRTGRRRLKLNGSRSHTGRSRASCWRSPASRASEFNSYSTRFSEATCYVAREIALPDDPRINSRFHFGVDYRPDLAEQVIGSAGLPLPPGLSGSTVWNTRFVEARMAGVPWTPDLAVVTGVVWGWPSDHGSIVATRAEYVRSFLLQAARDLGAGI